MASKIEVEQMLNIQTNALFDLYEKHYDCACLAKEIEMACTVLDTLKLKTSAAMLHLMSLKLEFNHCEKINNWEAFEELVIKDRQE